MHLYMHFHSFSFKQIWKIEPMHTFMHSQPKNKEIHAFINIHISLLYKVSTLYISFECDLLLCKVSTSFISLVCDPLLRKVSTSFISLVCDPLLCKVMTLYISLVCDLLLCKIFFHLFGM